MQTMMAQPATASLPRRRGRIRGRVGEIGFAFCRPCSAGTYWLGGCLAIGAVLIAALRSPATPFLLLLHFGWGWGPASDGKTLFAGPAGSCDWFGCERTHVPGDGGAVWGECGQRCEVVAALAGERQCCGQADGRLETTAAEKRTGVAAGADRREAGSDLARSGGRTR